MATPQLPDQGIQDGDGALGLERVDKVGSAPAIVRQRIGRGRGKFTGNAPDGIGGDLGDGRGPFRGVLAHRSCQLVEPGSLVDERDAVVQLFR